MSLINLKRWLREPAAINAAQILAYVIAVIAGSAAAIGAIAPVFLSATIGPIIVTVVGTTIAVGGTIGALSVARGLWWLERVALIITGVGWTMLLPPALFYSFTSHNSSIWLVLALVATAILDVFKRYRRIDWAYLDPAK